MNLDRSIDIGTDVASFFLFHPEDLTHRKDDPLDWYTYNFACRKEFEAGNLIAFMTGGDGGYQIRLTGGDLSDAEKALATGSWEWGYTVRHGKVLVDNGDHLPSEEAFDVAEVSADHWVELPNGDYRVTVYPIAREDDSLADYVIRFETVSAPLHIARSPSPPDLTPLQDTPPQAIEGVSADAVYAPDADEEPLEETYPLLVAANQVVLPGSSTSVAVTDDLFDAVRNEDSSLTRDGDIYIVFAPSEEIPGLATLAWVNGSSQITGEPGRLSMRGQRLVRIVERKEGMPLPQARVEAVTRPNSPLSEPEFQALQAAFQNYADTHAEGADSIPAFERERIAAMTAGKALTARLLELAPLPVETRLRLQAMSDVERSKELLHLLKNA